eukprot:6174240-Pleurochrysis_carterae.AAC.1
MDIHQSETKKIEIVKDLFIYFNTRAGCFDVSRSYFARSEHDFLSSVTVMGDGDVIIHQL